MSKPNAANGWVLLPRPNQEASVRLFCFPYAGAGASVFVTWARTLPPQAELCLVQLPGRENRLREPLHRRLLPLVDAMTPCLASCLDRPFVIFGHSMGALVAFELVRHLRRAGGPMPIHLFVSGCQAPHLYDREPPLFDMPQAEFVREVQRRYRGLGPAVLDNPELMEIYLPILRADFELVDTYRSAADAPLECPITAMGGEDDCIVREDLAAWQTHTRGPFRLLMLPGDHFFVDTARDAVLATVGAELRRSPPVGSGRPCSMK